MRLQVFCKWSSNAQWHSMYFRSSLCHLPHQSCRLLKKQKKHIMSFKENKHMNHTKRCYKPNGKSRFLCVMLPLPSVGPKNDRHQSVQIESMSPQRPARTLKQSQPVIRLIMVYICLYLFVSIYIYGFGFLLTFPGQDV